VEDDSEDLTAPAADGPVSGLFKSVSNLFATLISIAQTRVELLTTELQAEVQRSGEIIVWTLVALLSAAMALLWIAIFFVVLLWDTHRLLAGLSVIAFFSLLAVTAGLVLRAKIRGKPKLLEGTRAELAKDREQLSRRAHG
jgi:uncharacterized membrane protein YqjE